MKCARGLGNDFSILQLAERLISLAANRLRLAEAHSNRAEPSGRADL